MKSILCLLFLSASGSLVSAALPEPEPQSTAGLQRLPDGERERPAAEHLGPVLLCSYLLPGPAYVVSGSCLLGGAGSWEVVFGT